jgi:hypothetical protein
MDSEVPADERRQASHVLIPYRVALRFELADGGVQVHRGPQNNAIQDESEDAELVLQSAFIAVVQLALLAVADLAGEGVAAFLEVADVLDVATVGLVDVDVVEDYVESTVVKSRRSAARVSKLRLRRSRRASTAA